MSGFQPAETLRQHRPLLLALEAIGWLHMTGKAKVYFLRDPEGKSGYKQWHKELGDSLDTIFDWLDQHLQKAYKEWKLPGLPPNLKNLLESMFQDFAEYQSKKNLVGLLQASHAMASGIEKNLPKNTSKYLAQDATHMWLSTAFGQPVRNLLNDPPELLTEVGWKRLLGQIEELLKNLETLGNPTSPHTTNDLDAWWHWRDDAVGPNGWLRKAFTCTLAETRLPNNDVTLFDQSYVAAALFKSAAAGALLEGKSFPWDSSSLKQQTRWRLLTIGIGADHYEARAVKIGDWTGARLALDEFFRKACRLVEVDLAVGSLLYADGEVCGFSFPGERFNHNGGDLQIKEWENWLTERIDGHAREAELETPPYCRISEPSRSLIGMTAEIQKARKEMAVPLHRSWEITSGNLSEGHVCPVCLVRRKGNSTSKQFPCKPCKNRRAGRLKTWLGEEPGADTIWISEVADSNDRAALITMSLDIEPWLDASRLDSLRTQAISEWRKFNPDLNNQPNPIDPRICFDSLFQYVKGKLASFDKNDLVLKNLQEGYRYESNWKSFFSKIVEDRANAPQWHQIDDDERARWLAHQLFRKLASPGRIYRFQRQAEEFFKELLVEFRRIADVEQNQWRRRRLFLTPTTSGSWTDCQPYNGRISDQPLDLLYLRDKGGFVTISNISRILEIKQDKDSLRGKTLRLKDDDNNPADPLTIQSVKEGEKILGTYHPVISLDLSPVRFRILVPLEAASKCVDRAIEAWNEQFARVWDRLPLRVGVVAFPRKTPFQAVIEAARNMEADLAENSTCSETWRINHTETREGGIALDLACPGGEHELRIVPAELPDGREDVFYPYLAVEDRQVRFPHDFRHPDGRTYRHVKDLQVGDGLLVYPSYIATVFLDSTAKRFEPLKCRYLGQWHCMRELWQLIDGNIPSQTALRGAWSELIGKRDSWQEPGPPPTAPAAQAGRTWLEGGEEAWLDLARAMFHRRLGVRGVDLETLVEAARDGLLDWCLEWHMSILKRRISGGDR